jgi:hypothetical protein
MDQQYVDLFDLLAIYEEIEGKGGPVLLAEFRDVLDEAILAKYDVESDLDFVARYSNDPTSLLWRDGEVNYPAGVFYFQLIERYFVGEVMGASVRAFILIDYPNRTIIDQSASIIDTH